MAIALAHIRSIFALFQATPHPPHAGKRPFFRRTLANAISADGSVIVGQSRNAFGEIEAFRWTESGMVGLGTIEGGEYSTAHGVSADGSVVVGITDNALGDHEAFRWEDGNMVSLGTLGGVSSAFDVSADGAIIVGLSSRQNTPSKQEACVFVSDEVYALRELLTDHGLDLTGWYLANAHSVSDDGKVIAGTGKDPTGKNVAWIATIPEPSTVVLAAIGLLGMLALTWGERRSR